jgi:hypothetical protein
MDEQHADGDSPREADDKAVNANDDIPGEGADLESRARDAGTVTSHQQRGANRENARKSTGPRTDAGRARSSQNTTVHGCWAEKVTPIARGPLRETAADLDSLRDEVLAPYRRYGALVQQLALSLVRQLIRGARLDRYEALAITTHAAQQIAVSKHHLGVDDAPEGLVELGALHALDPVDRCQRIHASVLKNVERTWRMLREAIALEQLQSIVGEDPRNEAD